jgi:hypothetical protein
VAIYPQSKKLEIRIHVDKILVRNRKLCILHSPQLSESDAIFLCVSILSNLVLCFISAVQVQLHWILSSKDLPLNRFVVRNNEAQPNHRSSCNCKHCPPSSRSSSPPQGRTVETHSNPIQLVDDPSSLVTNKPDVSYSKNWAGAVLIGTRYTKAIGSFVVQPPPPSDRAQPGSVSMAIPAAPQFYKHVSTGRNPAPQSRTMPSMNDIPTTPTTMSTTLVPQPVTPSL